MTRDDTSAHLRLAEVLAPLSLVTDLGMGLPDEQAMRSCLVAAGLARAMGADEETVHDVYYATLLEHLGCTATAVEEARHAAGDHLAARPLYSHTDFVRVPEMLGLLRQIGAGRGPIERGRFIVGAVAGFRWGPPVQAAVCEVAARLAGRLAMPVAVQEALGQMFERWDGNGEPRHLRGEAIALPARVANVASRAAALHAIGGSEAAIEGVRASRGGWLDPAIADCFLDHATDLLAAGDSGDVLTATLEAEPEPWRTVPRQDLDDMARAFGDMVDLLSPHTLGHSSGVAELAERAADALGLSMAECVTLRRAALLHDLGRLGVPAGVWEKAGALGAAEWERVRLHAYYTERILTRSPLLVAEAGIAGMHHERIDGSGYHRRSSAREQPLAARILAAADAYQAMRQQRAHRPALDAERAADALSEEARTGRLDAEAVSAVLRAAGVERAVDRRELPAGLSEREAEVLRLVAAGCSNREIADRLVISRRTAEHHVQHVYAKIGLSTRAGATLFALEHGLVPAHT